VLATDSDGNAAVVVREYMAGRVVTFHHAGNYASYGTLSNANVQRLYANAVAWVGSCGDADTADADADGFDDVACGGDDCDDSDAAIYPGALEYCDGVDDDCDGSADEDDAVDAATWFADADADGYGDADAASVACAAPAGFVADASDCGDTDARVYPGAPEACDGQDDGCDGLLPADESDADGDGYVACSVDLGGWGGAAITGDDDCDDTRADVYPGATDAPYDAIDQDCTGGDACDADADGFPSVACGGADCDDAATAVNPDAGEVWYDGLDGDCDDADDYDADADGHTSASYGGDDCDDARADVYPGAADAPYDGDVQDCDDSNEFDADEDGHGIAANGGDDCDDARSDVYPGAPDVWYDGIDANCDGADDLDQDGDGHALAEVGGDDCDDADAMVFPGATEVADDGVDQDCSGVDEVTVAEDTGEAPEDTGTPEADDQGCGCGTTAPTSGLGLLAAVAGLVRRRRRA
jgi:MYXO-CTERM domain-containing protein